MKHVMRILDRTGDTLVEWELDSERAIAEAEKIFATVSKQGATAFDVTQDPPVKKQIFDPQVKEYVVVPRLSGG